MKPELFFWVGDKKGETFMKSASDTNFYHALGKTPMRAGKTYRFIVIGHYGRMYPVRWAWLGRIIEYFRERRYDRTR